MPGINQLKPMSPTLSSEVRTVAAKKLGSNVSVAEGSVDLTTNKSFSQRVTSFFSRIGKSIADRFRGVKVAPQPQAQEVQKPTIQEVAPQPKLFKTGAPLNEKLEATKTFIRESSHVSVNETSMETLHETKASLNAILDQCKELKNEDFGPETTTAHEKISLLEQKINEKLTATLDIIDNHSNTVELGNKISNLSSLLDSDVHLDTYNQKKTEILNSPTQTVSQKTEALRSLATDIHHPLMEAAHSKMKGRVDQTKEAVKASFQQYTSSNSELKLNALLSKFSKQFVQQIDHVKEKVDTEGIRKEIKETTGSKGKKTSTADKETFKENISKMTDLYLEKELGRTYNTHMNEQYNVDWDTGTRADSEIDADIQSLAKELIPTGISDEGARDFFDQHIGSLTIGLSDAVTQGNDQFITGMFAHDSYIANLRTTANVAKGLDLAANALSNSASTSSSNLVDFSNQLDELSALNDISSNFIDYSSGFIRGLDEDVKFSADSIKDIINSVIPEDNKSDYSEEFKTDLSKYIMERFEKKGVVDSSGYAVKDGFDKKLQLISERRTGRSELQEKFSSGSNKQLFESINTNLLTALSKKHGLASAQRGQKGELENVQTQLGNDRTFGKTMVQDVKVKTTVWKNKFKEGTPAQKSLMLIGLKGNAMGLVEAGANFKTKIMESVEENSEVDVVGVAQEKVEEKLGPAGEGLFEAIETSGNILEKFTGDLAKLIDGNSGEGGVSEEGVSSADIVNTREKLQSYVDELNDLVSTFEEHANVIGNAVGESAGFILESIPQFGSVASAALIAKSIGKILKQSNDMNNLQVGLNKVNDLDLYLTEGDASDPQYQDGLEQRLSDFSKFTKIDSSRDKEYTELLFSCINLVSAPSGVAIGSVLKSATSMLSFDGDVSDDQLSTIAKRMLTVKDNFSNLAHGKDVDADEAADLSTQEADRFVQFTQEVGSENKRGNMYEFGAHFQQMSRSLPSANDMAESILRTVQTPK
jgi:hypothetical protein